MDPHVPPQSTSSLVNEPSGLHPALHTPPQLSPAQSTQLVLSLSRSLLTDKEMESTRSINQWQFYEEIISLTLCSPLPKPPPAVLFSCHEEGETERDTDSDRSQRRGWGWVIIDRELAKGPGLWDKQWRLLWGTGIDVWLKSENPPTVRNVWVRSLTPG